MISLTWQSLTLCGIHLLVRLELGLYQLYLEPASALFQIEMGFALYLLMWVLEQSGEEGSYPVDTNS